MEYNRGFFKKDQILLAVTFVLLYRFGEGQLVKMAAPFLMDSIEAGGLGLSVTDVGYINGVIGLLALTAGGILGGSSFQAWAKGMDVAYDRNNEPPQPSLLVFGG